MRGSRGGQPSTPAAAVRARASPIAPHPFRVRCDSDSIVATSHMPQLRASEETSRQVRCPHGRRVLSIVQLAAAQRPCRVASVARPQNLRVVDGRPSPPATPCFRLKRRPPIAYTNQSARTSVSDEFVHRETMTKTPTTTGSLVGYARVSSADQNLDLQQDALKRAGCSRVFKDKASGAKTERPGLDAALDYARSGDTLVVWRLDRLGRSLPHLLSTVSDLENRGVGFKSLQEAIDTTTSGGRLVFQIFGALAEFERNIIQERTQAGLVAARARGRRGGRPPKLSAKKRDLLYQLYDSREHSIADICGMVGVSRSGLYKYLGRRTEA